MSQVYITDTILRDAHQCLIATRLRTEDMLGICSELDAIGYWSLEVWGGATFDACIRFLKEDPWERLRTLRKALPNTPLQMLLRGQNLLGYRHYPDDVVYEFVKLSAKNGIDVFRIFDALNDVRNLEVSIKAVKALGKHAQGTIAYTTSPVHTLDSFITMGESLEAMGCDSVAIKDMAGLLTPFATAELVGALVKKLSIPVHLHSHATSGLAALCQLKAVENGCRHIDTAISAFAEGASHPGTETMVSAFNNTEYDTKLDLIKLQEVGAYFKTVRKKYHQFESEGTGIDTRVHVNQVPGGMISNLYNQLKQQNALEKIDEVMQEIPKVRAELGYPPLVTPTSQLVGTQAVFNVMTGERYRTITNEVKLYLQGRYGKAPGHVDKQVKQQAIGNEASIDCRPADLLKPELEALSKDMEELASSPEDVMIYAMFPDIGKEFLTARQQSNLVPEALEPIPSSEEAGVCGSRPKSFKATLHGETYDICITGSGQQEEANRPFYVTIDGVPEEIVLAIEDKDLQSASQQSQSGRPIASEPGHVTASMPGTVVDCLVAVGDNVTAGMPVLIIESMKMEAEVQAPQAGKVTALYVSKGDQVNPNEALIAIE